MVNESLNIVLVEPEIPPNTGNIARLCAATRSVLHLVHPLGFKTDDAHLKRAGLDYWKHVNVVHHKNLEAFLASVKDPSRLHLFSTRGKKPYTRGNYRLGDYLLFGKETAGLPQELLDELPDQTYCIPMWGKTRSLNLSTAVGIVTYHVYSTCIKEFDALACKVADTDT